MIAHMGLEPAATEYSCKSQARRENADIKGMNALNNLRKITEVLIL